MRNVPYRGDLGAILEKRRMVLQRWARKASCVPILIRCGSLECADWSLFLVNFIRHLRDGFADL